MADNEDSNKNTFNVNTDKGKKIEVDLMDSSYKVGPISIFMTVYGTNYIYFNQSMASALNMNLGWNYFRIGTASNNKDLVIIQKTDKDDDLANIKLNVVSNASGNKEIRPINNSGISYSLHQIINRNVNHTDFKAYRYRISGHKLNNNSIEFNLGYGHISILNRHSTSKKSQSPNP